jgi:predicted DNA-binding antitoxin AbrB/MazE fold protein
MKARAVYDHGVLKLPERIELEEKQADQKIVDEVIEHKGLYKEKE